MFSLFGTGDGDIREKVKVDSRNSNLRKQLRFCRQLRGLICTNYFAICNHDALPHVRSEDTAIKF